MADYFYVFASGDDEVEESKKEDEKKDDQDTVVEQKVEPAVCEPESPTLEELANSSFIQNRQLAAKSIVEHLREAGSNKEALHSVISIMCKLSEDEDLMVRSELMEHIPSIAIYCKENIDDLGVIIRQQIVPYTVKLITDIERQVRKIGHTTLLLLLEHNVIDDSQLSEWICPLIAQLATSESNPQQLRLEDVSVMCKMIPYVGKEITEKFFLEPFLSLCRDTTSSAAETCLHHFGSISRVIGREATETVLLSPFLALVGLCQGESKMKFVDICVELAGVVSATTRSEILSQVYMGFLKSESRTVTFAACQSLGRFISTFADPSKTGLSYIDGVWRNTSTEDASTEDQQKNGNYFELITSELMANPQFFDRCSFKNITGLYDSNESHQILETGNNNLRKTADNIYSEVRSSGMHKDQKTQSICKTNRNFNQTFNSNNSKMLSLQNSLNCEASQVAQSTIIAQKSSETGHTYHEDNENIFNNFQFWRIPLPEVELDTDILESKCNINLRTESHSEEDKSSFRTSNFDVRRLSHPSSKESGIVLEKSDSEKEFICELKNGYNMCFKDCCFNLNKRKAKNSYKPVDHEVKEKFLYVIQPIKKIDSINKEKMLYEQDIVPTELLSEYRNIIRNDDDMRQDLAYYFPSVAYTLGRKYWPCIKDIFHLLASDIRCQIRKIVASSLHELAVILGSDITNEDLLPVFLNMLEDHNLCYNSSILMNISSFLKRLKPDARKLFLPLIEGICMWEYTRDSNWRYRLIVSEQFIPCLELFSPSDALQFLPIALLLLQDKVCAVRKSGVSLLAVIIKYMVRDSSSFEFLKAALRALDEKYRKANKWLRRQMYVYICQELAVNRSLPIEFYVEEIVPNLFSLAYDTVPNVRLAVARCLGLTLLPLDFLPSIQKAHYQLLLQVMYSLQSDVDRDVRHFALLSASAFNVLPPKKESCESQFKKLDEYWEKLNEI